MSSKKTNSTILSVVHPICCGLDIHKDKISAAMLVSTDTGIDEEIREFGAFTDDLYQLRDWCAEKGCNVVAMESTGVYWQPVHNVLESFCTVILVNARHIKHLPGKKTDVSDSKWLAGLLRHGLLKGSFIPEKHVRQWRGFSRARKIYVENLSDYKRRVHRLFESANIKIDSVVSNLFGVTGQNLISVLLEGKTPSLSLVEQCARGRLKGKAQELLKTIQGFFEEHHRELLLSYMVMIDTLEQQIQIMQTRLSQLLSDRSEKLARLQEIPGISEVSASALIAEVGDTLDQFATASAFASWAGLCPGNNESAGKRHSGRNPVQGGLVKTIMVEAAWGATRKKESYYKEKYYSLKARKGAKKAIIAIAHRMLKAVFHILKYGASYKELGANYLTTLHAQSRVKRLHEQAAKMGFALIPQEL